MLDPKQADRQMHALLRMAADRKLELRTMTDGGTGYAIPGGHFLHPNSYSELGRLMREGDVMLTAHCCHTRRMDITVSGLEKLNAYDLAKPGAALRFKTDGVLALPVDATP